jgi:hypothetical protein
MKQGSLTQLIAMQNWWLSKTENPIRGTFNLDLLLKVVEAKQRCSQ